MSRKSILSSTPLKLFPRSRPSIRQSPHTLDANNYSDIQSDSQHKIMQIPETSPKRRSRSTPNSPNVQKKSRKLTSNSEGEEEDAEISNSEESGEESAKGESLEKFIDEKRSLTRKKIEEQPSLKTNLMVSIVFVGICWLISCYVFGINHMPLVDENPVTIDSIKSEFPQLGEEFWLTIASSIDEVVQFNRPASFIFLYETKTEPILDDLLTSLSSYILCKLSNCKETPIIVTDQELNQPKIVANYGVLIEKYRPLLEQKRLMIVKHLENISGVSAQIFHSMCDEYTPLVAKSLFIFTMKVDRMPDNSEDYLEQYFLKKWDVLKRDIFYALFTRITSMPLKIVS